MKKKGRVEVSEEARSAASNFMRGFWETPGVREGVSQAHRSAWTRYKATDRYEQLRQQLKAAWQTRKDNGW